MDTHHVRKSLYIHGMQDGSQLQLTWVGGYQQAVLVDVRLIDLPHVTELRLEYNRLMDLRNAIDNLVSKEPVQ